VSVGVDPGRTIASDALNPDFVQLAAAFGIDGKRVQTPKGLEGALRAALAENAPAVIEVPVGEMPDKYQLLNR
jgi:acetolactate synthase-1/2/3 large subunit